MWPSTPPTERRHSRSLASIAVLLAASWGVGAGAAAAPAQVSLLALRLNGVEQDDVVPALRVGTALAILPQTWQALRLKPPAGAPMTHDGREYQPLTSIDGLLWRVDEPSQTLLIDAPAGAFAGGRMAGSPSLPSARSGVDAGGYANYDFQWQRSRRDGGGERDAQALIDLGGFNAEGALRSTALLRTAGAPRRFTRLDTTWTTDMPSQLASLRLGDAVSQAGAWGRALRFGGVQWATDFSVSPGFLSFPLPSIRGEAALPSTVDVYINNSQRLQGKVPAGPFDVADVPVVTGQGELRMVVRDLLGREQVVVVPYYASPTLLRPGLRASSFELGAAREDYGLASNRYGRMFASATERLGVSDRFTAEWRVEGLGRQVAAGAAGVWLAPAWGILNASGAMSSAPSGRGGMAAVGAQRQALDWSGSLQWRGSSRGFTQAGQAAATAARNEITAALGGQWGHSSLGLNVLQRGSWQGDRQRFVSVNTSHSVGPNGVLGLFAQRDLVSRTVTVALSLSLAVGARDSVGVAATQRRVPGRGREADTRLEWQRSTPDGEGVGYQVVADQGAASRATAQALWQTGHAVFNGALATVVGGSDARLGASGALAWLGESVFLSRRIDGSFAVVEVGDYPGVQVLLEQRPVARTDARGRAMVSGLRGHEINRIGVDAADLPHDAEVEALELQVTPPARSGVVLSMPVRRSRGASFRLIGADGGVLPHGTALQIEGQSRTFPVGFEGKAFVSGLGERTRLIARWSGRECSVWLELAGPPLDEMPELGTLTCL
jgi:outer membrane usher protein